MKSSTKQTERKKKLEEQAFEALELAHLPEPNEQFTDAGFKGKKPKGEKA